MTKKPIDSLTPLDLAEHPIWRFTGSDSPDETYVSPYKKRPATSLSGCIIFGKLQLACGEEIKGYLGNIDLMMPRLTEHFITLSTFNSSGDLFHLARYHDNDSKERGPEQLAIFLGRPLEDVFPITYDISGIAEGDKACLKNFILIEPRERLTRSEIIALAVP